MSDTTDTAVPGASSASPANNELIDWENISLDDDDNTPNKTGTETPGAAGTSETPPTTDPPAADEAAISTAQEILALSGYEGNMVQYDGQVVDINTLQPSDQLEIAKQLLIAANARTPELEGDAKHLVDLLASGMSAKDLARQILGPELQGSQNALTDEQVGLQVMKSQYPKFTDAQLTAELEDIKGRPNYEAKLQMWREQIAEQNKPDLSKLSEQQVANLRAANEAEQARIVQAVAPMDKAMGLFELNDEQKNYILADLVEVEANGHTRFVNMQDDPKTQFEMRYAHAFMPQIVQHMQDYAVAEYNRGRDEALGNAPTKPIVAGTSGAAPAQNRNTPAPAGKNTSTAGEFNDADFERVHELG